MMIDERNQQNTTRHNGDYGAKDFVDCSRQGRIYGLRVFLEEF